MSWVQVAYVGLPVAVALVAVLYFVPKWQVRHAARPDPGKTFDRENEARKTLAQILGGLGILTTIYFGYENLAQAQQQHLLAERTNLTDRYAKSVEGLASHDEVQEHVGSIYALEQLALDAQDSALWDKDAAYREKQRVLALIAAYLKGTSPVQVKHPDVDMYELAPDLQAAIFVLSDRGLHDPGFEPVSVCHVNLQGADLRDRDLRGLDLSDVDFRNADMRGTTLDGDDLSGAILEGADLTDATAVKTLFCGADLRGAIVPNSVLATTKGDKDTQLSIEKESDRPLSWRGCD